MVERYCETCKKPVKDVRECMRKKHRINWNKEIEKIPETKSSISSIECIRCGSGRITKKGCYKTKFGIVLRYFCRDCRKSFHLSYKEVKKNPCSNCGSKKTYKAGFTVDGKQRYKCRCCGKRCV